MGRIGTRLAALCKAAFDMRVLGYDPRLPEQAVRDRGAEPRELPALLAEADFVSLHAPATPETRHLIDAAALGAMKPTAYLINHARGALVDTVALTEALRSRRIRGAALDVLETEPPPAGMELLRL